MKKESIPSPSLMTLKDFFEGHHMIYEGSHPPAWTSFAWARHISPPTLLELDKEPELSPDGKVLIIYLKITVNRAARRWRMRSKRAAAFWLASRSD